MRARTRRTTAQGFGDADGGGSRASRGHRLALAALVALLAAAFALPAAASADTFDSPTADPTFATAAPTIASDKDDYGPGETVTLTGSNWQSGESVRIVVNDDGLDPEQPWVRDVTVTADAAGLVFDQFSLPSWFVANYTVTATGESSGTATTAFTDAIPTTTTITSTPNP